MHEMALTRSVLEIVLAEAQARGAAEVRAVHLSIGSMRDIVEGMFEGLFAHLACGTIAEHAELVVTRVPVTVRCDDCGYLFHPKLGGVQRPVCPSCGRCDFRLATGLEFRVDAIDVAGEGLPHIA